MHDIIVTEQLSMGCLKEIQVPTKAEMHGLSEFLADAMVIIY